jgi:poly-gamma-glutamate synthesis protein (capsule biosynthesis protein)
VLAGVARILVVDVTKIDPVPQQMRQRPVGERDRQAIEAGFDIVHGHSAHILQALEYHQDGLILYDTGDFIADYWVFPGVRIDRSFVFLVHAARGRRPMLKLLPVLLTPCAVNFPSQREADAIRRAMTRRCRGYAVEFTNDGDALIASPLANREVGLVGQSE